MKQHRLIIIEAGVAEEAPEWGLAGGCFTWVTGRPGLGLRSTSEYAKNPYYDGGTEELSFDVDGLTPDIVGDGLNFDVYGNVFDFPNPLGEGLGLQSTSEYATNPDYDEDTEELSFDVDGLTPDIVGDGLNFDVYGITHAAEGILGKIDGPNLAAKLGIGGYATGGALVVGIARPGFQQFLDENGITLKNKRVWHYVAHDGLWEPRGLFAIDRATYSDGGDSLSCIDISRIIHKEAPGDRVTPEEFPRSSESQLDQTIPMALGFVNNAKLINVDDSETIEVIYKQGGVERTVTGTVSMYEFAGKTFDRWATEQEIRWPRTKLDPGVALIVGDDFVMPPEGFVGKTLVGYNRNIRRSRLITGQEPNVYSQGFRYKFIILYYNAPMQADSSLDPEEKVRPWDNEYATDVNQDGDFFESWTFEVWGSGAKRIISSAPIVSFVGDPKVSDSGGIERSPAIDFREFTTLPDSNRAGAEVLYGGVKNPDIGEQEYIHRFFVPTAIKYMKSSPLLSIYGGPTLSYGDDLPLLYDLNRSFSEGQAYAVVGTAVGVTRFELLMRVDLPDGFDLKSGESVYMAVDCLIDGYAPTGPVGTETSFMLSCTPITDVGKVASGLGLKEINGEVINRPVNERRSVLSDAPNQHATTVQFLSVPDSYYMQEPGEFITPTAHITTQNPNQNLVRFVGDILDVTKACEGNNTRSILVEIKYFQDRPVGSRMIVTQLGFYITRKTQTLPDSIYHSVIGEKYGPAWAGRRDAEAPVHGIVDMAEHLIRAVDGQPDLVDTDSFDHASSVRPALGSSAWFAGRQLREPKNTADLLDELMKSAMLLMVPGWDGKRRVIPWFDQMSPDVELIDNTRKVEGSFRDVTDTQSIDLYSEFDLLYDQKPIGGWNGRLAVIRTDEDVTWPDDEASFPSWRQYVIGMDDYQQAKNRWETLRARYLRTQIKNRLTLELPWLSDPSNGDPWTQAIADAFGSAITTEAAADRLLLYLMEYAAAERRVVRGELMPTAENLALQLGQCILFRDQELTTGKRWYGWITDIGTADDRLPVEIVTFPHNSPDTTVMFEFEDIEEGRGPAQYTDEDGTGLARVAPL